nr:MAG TPA: Minor fimbrium tip subunit Mfa3, ADHESIN, PERIODONTITIS, CELL ADHESION [Caudoviricetes sp.]
MNVNRKRRYFHHPMKIFSLILLCLYVALFF